MNQEATEHSDSNPPTAVGSNAQLGRLVEGSGLLECIDDAWQERGDWMPLVQAFADLVQAAERQRFPNLLPVIQWLENGCDPKEAAKELRVYQQMMSGPNVRAEPPP